MPGARGEPRGAGRTRKLTAANTCLVLGHFETGPGPGPGAPGESPPFMDHFDAVVVTDEAF